MSFIVYANINIWKYFFFYRKWWRKYFCATSIHAEKSAFSNFV